MTSEFCPRTANTSNVSKGLKSKMFYRYDNVAFSAISFRAFFAKEPEHEDLSL